MSGRLRCHACGLPIYRDREAYLEEHNPPAFEKVFSHIVCPEDKISLATEETSSIIQTNTRKGD